MNSHFAEVCPGGSGPSAILTVRFKHTSLVPRQGGARDYKHTYTHTPWNMIHKPHPHAHACHGAELDQHFSNKLCKHTHMHTVGPTLTPAVTDISMMVIFTSFYGYMKLNTTINDKFCKQTHTQPIQMMTSQHIPYLGNNLRVHLCGRIKSPDKIKVIIITDVLVVEDDVFYLWDQIGHVCWVC